MSLPKLFKKTNTGAIQSWEIRVEAQPDGTCHLLTEYGQVGGAMQTAMDIISEGKNVGKANQTTIQQQAEKEAKSKWEKQKKKSGYVETVEAALAGEVDALVQGGVQPMLAHVYADHAEKLHLPCYTQPKFDGIRCIAILAADGKCTLWSRTRKPINSVPHIVQALEQAFGRFKREIIFDGELYVHEYKSDFEKIVSAVRKDKPSPESAVVQYHIYDTITKAPFRSRIALLQDIFGEITSTSPLKLALTLSAATEEEIHSQFQKYREQGYEGAILRNAEGLYEVGKRSSNLLKLKEFDEAEFKIVGISEGRGKLIGHAAAFICEMTPGKTFEAKMKGELSRLKEYFQNPTLWQGKKLTVQYQGLTGANQVPRFPVGKAIRDYE